MSVLPTEPYLGGTAIAAIAGLSPYRAPIDVWRDLAPEERGGRTFTGNTATEWGLRLEAAIKDGYEAQTGRTLFRRNEIVIPEHPFIRLHPDWLVRGEPGIVDGKSGMNTQGYGEPGTDDVPPHVRVQLVLYTGASRREWWEVAHMGPGVWSRGLDIYRGAHDPELFARLVAVAVDWWEEHHLRDVPPPPDGTEAYRRYLADRFPRGEADVERVATPDDLPLLAEYFEAVAEASRTERARKALGVKVAALMRDATVLVSPFGKVTLRAVARASWKEIAERVAADAGIDLEPLVEESKAAYLADPAHLPELHPYPARERKAAA